MVTMSKVALARATQALEKVEQRHTAGLEKIDSKTRARSSAADARASKTRLSDAAKVPCVWESVQDVAVAVVVATRTETGFIAQGKPADELLAHPILVHIAADLQENVPGFVDLMGRCVLVPLTCVLAVRTNVRSFSFVNMCSCSSN